MMPMLLVWLGEFLTKAPDTFIKMAYEIKKSINEAFFVIVGDGEDRKECEALIKKLHLEDSFLITGWNDKSLWNM